MKKTTFVSALAISLVLIFAPMVAYAYDGSEVGENDAGSPVSDAFAQMVGQELESVPELTACAVEGGVSGISFAPASSAANMSDFIEDGEIEAEYRGTGGFLRGDRLTLTFSDGSSKTYTYSFSEAIDEDEFLCGNEGLPQSDWASQPRLQSSKIVVGDSVFHVSAYGMRSPDVTISVADDVDGNYESYWYITSNYYDAVQLGKGELSRVVGVYPEIRGTDCELAYQWYKYDDSEGGFVAIAGATASSLNAPAGRYKCVATDQNGKTSWERITLKSWVGEGGSAPESQAPVVSVVAGSPVEPYVNSATVTAADIQAMASQPTVTLGPAVKKIVPGAFAGTGVTTLVVKSSKLKKASVKNAFKGSNVKTVKVVVKELKPTKGLKGKALKKAKQYNKKAKAYNKKIAKKYAKLMTKKVVGKKVKVKA